MKRKEPDRGQTRLVWDDVFEELKCERCGAILYWNFGFRRCPYCKRRIAQVEARRARAVTR